MRATKEEVEWLRKKRDDDMMNPPWELGNIFALWELQMQANYVISSSNVFFFTMFSILIFYYATLEYYFPRAEKEIFFSCVADFVADKIAFLPSVAETSIYEG